MAELSKQMKSLIDRTANQAGSGSSNRNEPENEPQERDDSTIERQSGPQLSDGMKSFIDQTFDQGGNITPQQTKAPQMNMVPDRESLIRNNQDVFEAAREEKNEREKADIESDIIEKGGDPGGIEATLRKGSVDRVETAKDIGEFLDPTREVEFRPFMAPEGETTSRPGGGIVGNLEPLAARISEGVAMLAVQPSVEVASWMSGQEGRGEFDLGIDATRLGYDQEEANTMYQGILNDMERYDKQSPETPNLNRYLAFGRNFGHIVLAGMDAAGGAGSLARLAASSPDAATRQALKRLGVEGAQTGDEFIEGLVKTGKRIENANVPRSQKEAEMSQLFRDVQRIRDKSKIMDNYGVVDEPTRTPASENENIFQQTTRRAADEALSPQFRNNRRLGDFPNESPNVAEGGVDAGYGGQLAGDAADAAQQTPTSPGRGSAGAGIDEGAEATGMSLDETQAALPQGVREILGGELPVSPSESLPSPETQQTETPQEILSADEVPTSPQEETTPTDDVFDVSGDDDVIRVETDDGYIRLSGVTENPQTGGEYINIGNVQVDEAARGQGRATQLYDRAIQEAQERGYEGIVSDSAKIEDETGAVRSIQDNFNPDRMEAEMDLGVPTREGTFMSERNYSSDELIENQQEEARRMSQAGVMDETAEGNTITGYRARNMIDNTDGPGENVIKNAKPDDGMMGSPGVDVLSSLDETRRRGGVVDSREFDTSNFVRPSDEQIGEEVVENMLERAPKIEEILNESRDFQRENFDRKIGEMVDDIMGIENPQHQLREIWQMAYNTRNSGMLRADAADYFNRAATANNIDGIQRVDNAGNESLAVYNQEILEGTPKLTDDLTREERIDVALQPVEETTKVVKRVVDEFGLDTVNRQQIKNILNKTAKDSGVKKPERRAIEGALSEFDTDDIPVGDFISQVDSRLLPIKPMSLKENGGTRWEGERLSLGKRGDVESYDEYIYESPIHNTAGKKHFTSVDTSNYFMHTRVEYMPDGETVRINELQSDLMQEKRFERPVKELVENHGYSYDAITGLGEAVDKYGQETVVGYLSNERDQLRMSDEVIDDLEEMAGRAKNEMMNVSTTPAGGIYQTGEVRAGQASDVVSIVGDNLSLSNYKGIWHEMAIRNEIARYRDQGKSRVLFPGENTIANIENLDQMVGGETQSWIHTVESNISGSISERPRMADEEGLPEPAFDFENQWNEITYLEVGSYPGSTFIANSENVVHSYDIDDFVYEFPVLSHQSQKFANEYFDLGLGDVAMKSSRTIRDAIDDALGDLNDLELEDFIIEFARSQGNTPFFNKKDRLGNDSQLEGVTILRDDNYKTFSDLKEFYSESAERDRAQYADHPTVRFYTEDIADYLKKKYGAKKITDDQDMEWWEVKTETAPPGKPGAFGDDFFKPAARASKNKPPKKEQYYKAIARQDDPGRIEQIMRKDLNLGKHTREIAEGFTGERDAARVRSVIEDAVDSNRLTKREDGDDLMALHNVFEKDVDKALDAGGFAAPSIAVTRKGVPFEKFGDATFVFDKNVVDPRGANVRAYTGDTYTAETPQPEYENNLLEKWNTDEMADIRQRFEEAGVYTDDFDGNLKRSEFVRRATNNDIPEDEVEEMADRIFEGPFLTQKKNLPTGELRELVQESPAISEVFRQSSGWEDFRLRALNDQQVVEEIDNRARELGDEFVYDSEYREANRAYWNKLKRGYLDYLDYNDPEQISRYMHQQTSRGGDTRGVSAFNPSRIFAYDQVQTLDDIREMKHLFEEDEIAKASNQIMTDEYEEFMGDLGFGIEKREQFTEDILKSGYEDSEFSIVSTARRNDLYPNIDEEDAERISELLEKGFKQGKRNYAEVKPFRKVDFSEAEGAVIPDRWSDEKVQQLRDAGVRRIERYGTESNKSGQDGTGATAGDEGRTRQEAVNALGSENLFGGAAGIEKDEDGNWHIDPVKLAAGAAFAGALRRGGKLYRNGGNPIKHLQETLGKHPKYARVENKYLNLLRGTNPARTAQFTSDVQRMAENPKKVISGEQFQKVADMIENKETPNTNAVIQKELIDIVAQKMDDELVMYNRTPDIMDLQDNPVDVDAASREWKENADLVTDTSTNGTILSEARAGFQQLPGQSTPQEWKNLQREISKRAETDLSNINNSYLDDATKKIEGKEDAQEQFTLYGISDENIHTYDPIRSREIENMDFNYENYEDISGWKGQIRDMYRNSERVFGDDWDMVKKKVFDPLDDAKGRFVDEQKDILDTFEDDVVKGLDIKKGSNESRIVMDYGEGRMTREEVIDELGEERAQDIFEADQWFRQAYDNMLEEVNGVLKSVYPTSPQKWIPKRENYYRHFQELGDGFSDLMQVFETPAQIDPRLEGISAFTKPRSKWLSFAQERADGSTSERDAVGGFLNYVQPYAYTKHITPHIGGFRKLANKLAEETAPATRVDEGQEVVEDTSPLNNYIRSLHYYSNELAGKTNPADRYVQETIPGGRTTFRAIDWLNKRSKANVILGNAGSAVAQVFNIPQGIGSAGATNSAYGAARTIAQNFAENYPMQQSDFIAERYSDRMYNRFNISMTDKTKDFAAWITSIGDEIGTKFIWNAHYEKAIREGIENPIRWADNKTRRMVGGRGVGEVPIIQKSKLFQVVAPFQLEVQNVWHVLGDFVNKKQFGAIATTMVTVFLMNRVAEEIRGSDVAFDPINAMWEGYKLFESDPNKWRGAGRAGGRLVGEVLSNVVFGQTIAAQYPQYGTEIGGVKLPSREEFFGDEDPTRFGTSPLVMQSAQDPLYKILPPFGGGQLKKTVGGAKAIRNGDVVRADGKLMYEVDTNSPESIIKNLIFGKYSTDEAREYFDEETENRILENEMEALYEENQKLLEEGNEEEAQVNVDALTPSAYREYEKVKTQKKREQTEENIDNMLPVVRQNKALIREGKEEQAQKVVDNMTEEEYEAYEDARNRYEKDDFSFEEEREERGIINTVATYAKAVGTDPKTAFERIYEGETIRRTDNGAIIVYRMPYEESREIRAERGAYATSTELELDHKMPLQLGGSNSEENLELVEIDTHSEYTKIGNYLGKKLRNYKLTKYQVQNLMKLFRDGKIGEADVREFEPSDEINDLIR